MTAAELKAAMQALGLTYAEVAALASQERTDGKATCISTISNQANGKYPVDPFLALYLKERMRAA